MNIFFYRNLISDTFSDAKIKHWIYTCVVQFSLFDRYTWMSEYYNQFACFLMMSFDFNILDLHDLKLVLILRLAGDRI